MAISTNSGGIGYLGWGGVMIKVGGRGKVFGIRRGWMKAGPGRGKRRWTGERNRKTTLGGRPLNVKGNFLWCIPL